jgi:hypothetical protein
MAKIVKRKGTQLLIRGINRKIKPKYNITTWLIN